MGFSDFELGGAVASSTVKISDNVVIIKGYCCGAASHPRGLGGAGCISGGEAPLARASGFPS
jgi:hypothetical protein